MLFAFLVVAILVFRSGGLVGTEKKYASGGNDLGVEFGAFNGILFFCTSAFLVASRLLKYPPRQTLVILLILYIFPILTGSRADFLMQIALIVFVLLRVDSQRLGQQPRIPLLKIVFGVITLFFLAQYIGVWRHVGDFGLAFQVFWDSWSLFSERSSGVVLSLSTGNQMAGHFYAVHAKSSYLSEPFLLGSSYFDFLLRTPPGFLGLPRPQDLA